MRVLPALREAKAGRLLESRFQDQPGQQSKTSSLQKKNKTKLALRGGMRL